MEPEVRITVACALVSVFLMSLDSTIVAAVLPLVIEDLGGTGLYAWVATAFLVTGAVAMPVAGRLAETGHPRKLFLGSIVVFTVGSILCGLAPSIKFLILSRALQGLGGGAMTTVVGTIVAQVFPGRERGRYLGYLGTVLGAAALLGPLTGGVLADSFSWRAVFYINVPPALMVLFLVATRMPDFSLGRRTQFDLLGAVSLVAWTVPLLVALSTGGSTFPWTSPLVLGLFALFAGAMALFVRAELRSPAPLVELRLFSDPLFLWSAVAILLSSGVLMGATLFLPLYYVQVKGFSATQAGLGMLPGTVGTVASATLAGRLLARFGRYRPLLLAGTAASSVVLVALGQGLEVDTPTPLVLAALGGLGLSMGLLLPIFPVTVQSTVSQERLGTATSAAQFFRQLGGTMGTALMGTLMVAALQTSLPRHLPADLAPAVWASSVPSFRDEKDLKAGMRALVTTLRSRIEAADLGDPAAREALKGDLLVPPELRAEVRKPGPMPQSLLDNELALLADRLEIMVERTIDQTLTDSTRQVFMCCAVMALLSLLACTAMPDRQL